MKLFLEKSKCKFSESINGFLVEVETLGPIEFTGGDGGDYLLFDEDEEGIGPAPWKPFVVEKPKQTCMTNAELMQAKGCRRYGE